MSDTGDNNRINHMDVATATNTIADPNAATVLDAATDNVFDTRPETIDIGNALDSITSILGDVQDFVALTGYNVDNYYSSPIESEKIIFLKSTLYLIKKSLKLLKISLPGVNAKDALKGSLVETAEMDEECIKPILKGNTIPSTILGASQICSMYMARLHISIEEVIGVILLNKTSCVFSDGKYKLDTATGELLRPDNYVKITKPLSEQVYPEYYELVNVNFANINMEIIVYWCIYLLLGAQKIVTLQKNTVNTEDYVGWLIDAIDKFDDDILAEPLPESELREQSVKIWGSIAYQGLEAIAKLTSHQISANSQ